MTCIEQPLIRPIVHPVYWECLRTQMLKVRWPGNSNPYTAFAMVQGTLFGLLMTGAIDQEVSNRVFWLLTNAQDRRLAEQHKQVQQAEQLE